MKIVFSTKNVNRASFLDTCRYAYDYGFEGFEIYDAIKERVNHFDSILRRDRTADSKRKLLNRNLAVSALCMPDAIDNDVVTAEIVEKYVELASLAGISSVIVYLDGEISFEILDKNIKRRTTLSPVLIESGNLALDFLVTQIIMQNMKINMLAE